MVVFCRRENEHATFTCKGDEDFPMEPLLTALDVQKKEIVFAFPDIHENKVLTMTLSAAIAQELYANGRLKFEK